MSEPIDSDGDPLKLTEDATCGGLGEVEQMHQICSMDARAAYLLGLVRTPELSPTFNAYDMADSSLEIFLCHTYTRVRRLEATSSPLPDCIVYESQTLNNLATIKPKIPCQPTCQIGRGARSQITSSNRVIFQPVQRDISVALAPRADATQWRVQAALR